MLVAGALAAGALAAVRPAAWVVRFAVATPHGSPLLAYWAAVLAAGLPAMHRLASRRRIPVILLRKAPPPPDHLCTLEP